MVSKLGNRGKQAKENNLTLIGEGETFKDELCSMIERAQMFVDFPRDEIRILAGYARAYEVQKDDTIFKEGEKGSFMCILIEGRVDVYKETDDSHPKRITTIRPGKTMGEMSILDELPYSATTVATEKVTVVLITKFNFDRMTEDHPVLGVKILKKIARLVSLRLRQTTGILIDYLS